MRPILSMLMLMLALFAAPSTADAARRCGRCGHVVAHVHTCGSGYYCDSCYRSYKPKAVGWRDALTAIAARKADNEAFNQGLQAILGTGQGGYASAQASAGGYGYAQSTAGEYSSYPVQGNTLLGVNAYSNHPLVDLNATLNLQGKLAQQLAQGAHASATDTADLASTVYTLENDRQAKIAAFSAVQAIAQGAPPQPTVNTFRFQQTTQPSDSSVGGTVSASATASGGVIDPNMPTFASVISTKCASCHSGPEAKGGLDMSDLDLAAVEKMIERINLPPSDPKFMPQVAGEGGTVPGEPLSWKDRHSLEAALLSVQAQPAQ